MNTLTTFSPDTRKETPLTAQEIVQALQRPQQTTLKDAFETFVRVALVDRSPNTVLTYRSRVGSLIKYLGADCLIDTIETSDLIDWFTSLKKSNGGDYSIHALDGSVRTTRRFFRWLVDYGLLDKSPAHGLQLPRFQRRKGETTMQETPDTTPKSKTVFVLQPDITESPAQPDTPDMPAQSLRALLGNDEVTLGNAFETFIIVGLAGLDPKTVRFYRNRAGRFIDHLGTDYPLQSVMLADLLDWYVALKNDDEWDYEPHTMHGFVRATRRFFKWLVEQGLLTESPADNLPLPKLPRNGQKGIEETHVRAIIEVVKDNPRNHALLRFLESTGCRMGGLLGLQMSDLDLDRPDPFCRRVTVREKGSKSRTVFLSPGALQALRDYLPVRAVCAEGHTESDNCTCDKFSNVWIGRRAGRAYEPLKATGVRLLITRAAKKAGIPRDAKISAHQWRHRWARKMLQEGMEISLVSQLMGHEGVDITVRYYGQFAVNQLQNAYDRYLPNDF